MAYYRHVEPMGMQQSLYHLHTIAMQAASAHVRQSAYLPIAGGSEPPSLQCTDFIHYIQTTLSRGGEEHTQTPLLLLALLLFTLPLLFTFRKLVSLSELAERSHQFVNEDEPKASLQTRTLSIFFVCFTPIRVSSYNTDKQFFFRVDVIDPFLKEMIRNAEQ